MHVQQELGTKDSASARPPPGDRGALGASLDGEDLEGLAVQRRLHQHYMTLLAEPECFAAVPSLQQLHEIDRIERAWIALVDARCAGFGLPAHAAEFRNWYFEHAARHTQLIAGLTTHLEHHASIEDMATFFVVEEKVDSKFDDLMALAQLGTSGAVKLAIGANYWDEMGGGDPGMVHTTMFNTSVTWMRAQLDARAAGASAELPEVYANANQLLMYGLNRRYAPRLLGALGVLEQTASLRFRTMVEGCTRLGVPPDVITYQRVHVSVDSDHGAAWFENVLFPLVQRSPELLGEICRGVLTRCEVAVRYYNTVLSQLLSVKRTGSP